MNSLHIASFDGTSGISRYAKDFFDLVLQPRGFDARLPSDFDSPGSIPPSTRIHLEIGVNETETTALLYRLLSRHFNNLSITLHDPPFISWPYFKFRNRMLANLSKAALLYLRNFGFGEKDIERISKVFILSHQGLKATQIRYPKANALHLPFLAPSCSNPLSASSFKPNLLFFGFIAKNKGVEYALQLHRKLLNRHPEVEIFVVGRPIDNTAETYLQLLKSEYSQNVHYLGYVPNSEIERVFSSASIAVMPFESYRSIVPASASIMDAMRRGHIVCATPVNAVGEFIRHGETGFFLSHDTCRDADLLSELINSPDRAALISQNAIQHLMDNHCAAAVGRAFDC